ncbi:hypothetical protein H9P43_002068 [Blastocladiella emersonii ATCC 22665]|nr:hypothetical protein H9P43_002068 [Blastocladiella emersonii ATCC 22665]
MFTLLHLTRTRALTAAAAPSRSAVRRVAGIAGRVVADTAVVGAAYVAYQHEVKQDPWYRKTVKGLVRPAQFWTRVAPILAHYRYVQFKLDWTAAAEPERDAAFDELHERYAPVALALILDLRSLFIKFGQVCATRADVVPRQYRAAFASLLDAVPPLTADESRLLAAEALGRPLDEVFAEFDPVPLGSASIGQAHVARLKGDGREVVVKLQFPDAETLFDIDLTTAEQFVALVQPQQLQFLREMRKQIITEFDFKREAESLETVRANLDRAGLLREHRVAVPRVVKELSNGRVVVMERLPGTKLVDAVLDYYTGLAEAMGMSLDGFMADGMAAKLRRGGLAAMTPPPSRDGANGAPAAQRGPAMPSYRTLARGAVHMYWNQYVGWYAAWAWNHTVGAATSRLAVSYPVVAPPPLDGESLVASLFAVHGHQLLVDGFFNGDPHPGNILLSRSPVDGHGEIGLIDYGQVKALTTAQRHVLARLFVALADEDRAGAVAALREAGVGTPASDANTLYEIAAVMLTAPRRDMWRNMEKLRKAPDARESMMAFPEWIMLPIRMTLLLRSLGMLLVPYNPVSPAAMWRPIAERVLAEEAGEVGV